MTDRPLAICRDGQLWMDRGFAEYEASDPYQVRLWLAHFTERTQQAPVLSPLSADYVRQLQAALDQYNAFHKEPA